MTRKAIIVRLSRKPKFKTRAKNFCKISGRTRGYIRRFGMSRIVFRQKALQGEIPGVVKISW